jgi:hypothetical protein
MAIYFHRVSFSGLSANAFVVPLLGMVIPVGFIAVFHWMERACLDLRMAAGDVEIRR